MPLIPAGLLVQQVLPALDRITIVTTPRQDAAACPGCAVCSSRVHSRYNRLLGDLPWQGRPVTLQVQARRFRCLNPLCARQTFAEYLPGVAAAGARRTERLCGLQGCLGVALGGEAGARLAARLAMATSPDTLLRMVRASSKGGDTPPTPRVLGVDDWSWRRGHRYGTVLVDLERNKVVDLLPDRQVGTLAAWLKGHPGVEVIARDRAGAYADGARQGAPDAVQVADRWHMLRNLGDAVHALAEAHSSATRRAAKAVAEACEATAVAAAVPEPAPCTLTAAQRASHASLTRRQARYEEVASLHGKGVSISRIAALLGADRKTVRSWLRLGRAPSWNKSRRGSQLDPFVPTLERRWAEGCHNAARLWREVAGEGYAGRPGTVRTWATRRRRAQPGPGLPHTAPGAPAWQTPTGRRAARLLMADPEKLADDERVFITRLLADTPKLAEAVSVAKRFHQVLRREGGETLQDVLAAASTTLLANFAASLGRDSDAVQAALDLPWTTSPVEGQVNRIKTIKRTMYGRAGFDLLRARVLQAA